MDKKFFIVKAIIEEKNLHGYLSVAERLRYVLNLEVFVLRPTEPVVIATKKMHGKGKKPKKDKKLKAPRTLATVALRTEVLKLMSNGFPIATGAVGEKFGLANPTSFLKRMTQLKLIKRHPLKKGYWVNNDYPKSVSLKGDNVTAPVPQ